MSEHTLRYMRHDTTQPPGRGRRDDPRLGGAMVSLDGPPDPASVQTVLIGVADDRGVGLCGGRLGAIEGPLRFRDVFWRMHAPAGLRGGALLDAGDLVGAVRTNETHARLTEVVDVLRARFPTARMLLVGGGHDHAYGEVLGLARSLRGRQGRSGRRSVRIAHLCIDAGANVQAEQGEPTAASPLRRLLCEPAACLDGASLHVWGLQRAANAEKHFAFLEGRGVKVTPWEEIAADPGTATAALLAHIEEAAKAHDALSLSIDLSGFCQAEAPGVSAPSVVGVPVAAVLRAVAALGRLSSPTQLGIYELNPRFDRDNATTRLAARIGWSYATGRG